MWSLPTPSQDKAQASGAWNRGFESCPARQTTWASPENRSRLGFYITQRSGPRPRRLAHKKLLENPQLKRWYDNVSRASELTAEVDLRRLGLFCNRSRLTPLGLLEKQPQEIHSLLVDTVTELEKKGYAGSYLQGIVKGVKSWLSFNNSDVCSGAHN